MSKGHKKTSIRTIACVLIMSMSIGAGAQDFARLGERSIIGSARYIGMSGAMSAIGGDASATHDNIAGLGLYRRAETMLTIDVTHGVGRTYMTVPQASLIFSLPTFRSDEEGIQFHNFMFSYRRYHSYSRSWYGEGTGDASLGALIANADVKWDIDFCKNRTNALNALSLSENGQVHAFSFGWATNISNKWYVGASLEMESYMLSADARYTEYFATTNTSGEAYMNSNRTTLLHSGTSVSLSGGLIYRPTGWLRLGFGIQTPSLGSLTTYTTGVLTAQTDSLRTSTAPNISYEDNTFHMPLHTSTSVAFQIGAYGMIGMQYDYFYKGKDDPLHSMRVGIEVIPILGMYVQAGYAYESSFRQAERAVKMDPTFERQDTYFMYPHGAQYASVGIGYRGRHMMVQAAYQYRWQKTNLYAHENAHPYNISGDTHRVVVSIGWHQNW